MTPAQLEEMKYEVYAVQPEDDGMVFLRPDLLNYFADDETTPENWNRFIRMIYGEEKNQFRFLDRVVLTQ